ncbi:hypothetical protein [Delftia tsuruhatensis]|uniref:hypothetical protein n=1 Tax=Delftia tsuruhatensis TaxID=180282 RepID=UPI002AD500E1|nr:hypothetical protein [Delftia tsuruhatensis]WQM81740.1 hypothetical protein RNT40_23980 [Delftia tsuruhatensis]
MKERPILFSAPMVRAILAGTKTQTRRILKLKWGFDVEERDDGTLWPWAQHPDCDDDVWMPCPQGEIGDTLWVRESGAMHPLAAPEDPAQPWLFRHDVQATASLGHYWVQRTRAPGASYSAECTREQFLRHASAKVVPSIHMPRWACRILLDIKAVRVERLQDISEADCRAEGAHGGHGSIPGYGYSATPLEHFQHIWKSTGGDWDANPWVWVVEFERAQAQQKGPQQ